MHIVLVGATGFVGAALLQEALHRGHTVTAIVRHPEKLARQAGLVAKAGDVYDADHLAMVIRGHDALISAFNPGWQHPDLYDDQVRGTKSIIAAVKKAGLTRVLWVGGAGGLEAGISVLALRDQILPPTINLETPDPECDLDYVPNHARKASVEYALSNSFGFGGTNAALIFKRWSGK